jgi:ribosomal protein S6--L-glutamate ligase
MKILVVSRRRRSYSARRLREEGLARGHEVILADPFRCVLLLGDRPQVVLGRRDLSDVDVVIPRVTTNGLDYTVAVLRHFELMGIPLVNPAEAIATAKDKLGTLQKLAGAGLRVPPSVLLRSSSSIHRLLRRINGTPVVLKLLRGSQGIGVALAETPRAAVSVVEALLSLGQDVLLQQCIRESIGQDIRAFVAGQRVVAAMRRVALDDEFRANLHRGAVGEGVVLSPDLQRIAVTAAQAVGLGVAGVDLLETAGGPIVLEVNASPGLQGIESSTGINVARILIDHAIQRARQGSRRPRAAVVV